MSHTTSNGAPVPDGAATHVAVYAPPRSNAALAAALRVDAAAETAVAAPLTVGPAGAPPELADCAAQAAVALHHALRAGPDD